jgi:hypothetical protein
MDTTRLDSIEYRLSKLEVAVRELHIPKKSHHSTFIIPEDVSEMFPKLVALRKELIKRTHRNELNLIFNGEKLTQIIRQKSLVGIRGIGKKNIDEFEDEFHKVLFPEPIPPPPESKDPAVLSSEAIKKLKLKTKSKMTLS